MEYFLRYCYEHFVIEVLEFELENKIDDMGASTQFYLSVSKKYVYANYN